jgi:DivIVA domain-containing protein
MRRAITPEDVREADFKVALRGYDREDVAAFLQDVAAEMETLKDSSERAYQSLGEEIGGLLQQAKDSADKLVTDARTEAEAHLQAAANQAAGLTQEAEANALQSRQQTEAYSVQVREETEAYARQIREEAGAWAASARAEAEQDAAERIRTAEAQVRELEMAEAEARQRISGLRVELHRVADRLSQLGADESLGTETEPELEAPADEQDRVDTQINVEVQEPVT